MNSLDSATPTQGLILIVSAPSGAGKTTVVEGLLAQRANLSRAVTHTTRTPRPGERDGVDYHFVDRKAFTAMDTRNAFLEQAEIYGHRYGTSLWEVESRTQAGGDVVLVIDWQGARHVRERLAGNPAARLFSVFLLPPSVEELERRLRGRGSEDSEQLQRRLGMAREEMNHAHEYDACLVNADLAETVHTLNTWVDRFKAGSRPYVPCP